MSRSGEEHNHSGQVPGSDRRNPNASAEASRQGTANPGKTVYLLDQMEVRDLANALHLKPFKVVAELIEMKLFKSAGDLIDFKTASAIARKHGFTPEKPPPGMLIL